VSALHSRRGCWCGDNHTVTENVLLAIDHLNTVAEAAVLGPYEEELGKRSEPDA
jgi:hypothetical protein